MKMDQLVECNKCGKTTPIVHKTDELPNGIKHEYAECQQCGYKATFFYSDKELRTLLFRQSHTKNPKKKQELFDKIQRKIDSLILIHGA
jgi:DNA-directed RNA polymerase subunit RPC12/RpoP